MDESPPTATALLFPGQGTQKADMEDRVAAGAPELHAAAIELVGENPFELAGEGTRYAQPAIFCASLAAWVAAGRPNADFFAGHSLGDLTALTAAGAFSFEDGLLLAAERGRLMEDAAGEQRGGMVAMLGDARSAREIAERFELVVANDNAPDQLVLSGPERAIAAAVELAAERGLKAIELRVSGAFHTAAVAAAAEPFRELVASLPASAPAVPVVSCTSGEPFGGDLADELAAALTAPVLWRQGVLSLASRGVSRFVDIGPGKALAGLVRRTLPDAEVLRLGQLEGALV